MPLTRLDTKSCPTFQTCSLPAAPEVSPGGAKTPFPKPGNPSVDRCPQGSSSRRELTPRDSTHQLPFHLSKTAIEYP